MKQNSVIKIFEKSSWIKKNQQLRKSHFMTAQDLRQSVMESGNKHPN